MQADKSPIPANDCSATFQFRFCRLDYYADKQYCETVFVDGAICPASPENTPEYKQTAQDLGYGDKLMLMCLHHELLHTVLAEAIGELFSEVLHDVATGVVGSPARALAEEERVLALQRLIMRASRLAP